MEIYDFLGFDEIEGIIEYYDENGSWIELYDFARDPWPVFT